MKILYVITQGESGGAQKYVLSLARHFGGQIAAGIEHQELFKSATKFGLVCHPLSHLKRRINPYHDFFSIFELIKLIIKTRPDIVHLNSSKAGVVGCIAGKLCGCKVVYTAHGFVFLEHHGLIKWFYVALEKFASLFRDFIISVSENDHQSALNYQIISSNKIATIYNGISRIDFLDKSTARQKLSIPDDEFIIGTIANFYHSKGLDLLVQAVKSLAGKKFKVVIIGGGRGLINIKTLVDSIGLIDRFRFTGSIEEASKYLKAFDLFVLPSRKEGFPYVLLEAMQAKLPIIATEVGGVREALGDQGLIIPPNDAVILTKAIEQTLSNTPPANYSSNFTEQRMLSETQKIYQSLS